MFNKFYKRHTLPEDMTDTGAEQKSGTFPLVIDIPIILILFFLTQAFAAFILSLFGLNIPGIAELQADDIESYMSAQISRGEGVSVLYVTSMSLSLLAILLYIRLRSGEWIRIRHSVSGFNPNIILSGIVWIIVAQIVTEPLVAILPSMDNAGVGRGVWACVTAVILAPVYEELICRGIILESARRRWGKITAIVISALFFGFVHIEPSTMLAGFVVGIILGITYIRTSSIFSTVILHSVNNIIAFALVCFGMNDIMLRDVISDQNIYLSVYLISLFLFVILSVNACRNVFFRKHNNINGKL